MGLSASALLSAFGMRHRERVSGTVGISNASLGRRLGNEHKISVTQGNLVRGSLSPRIAKTVVSMVVDSLSVRRGRRGRLRSVVIKNANTLSARSYEMRKENCFSQVLSFEALERRELLKPSNPWEDLIEELKKFFDPWPQFR